MPRKLFSTDSVWEGPWSEIIDVLSPREYAFDHVPGAVNLCVLNDEERQEVGYTYKQESAFLGRKKGAAMVSRNIGSMLQDFFANKDESYVPLVYCFRGGQRSRSLATILSEVGWTVYVLEGGYKRYRAIVRADIETLPLKFSYRVVCGCTGSGKTELLRILQERGEQVLDIEALARHQGSLLGVNYQEAQPSQCYFESLLAGTLRSFSPMRPVWIEAESPRLGGVHLPPSLLSAMYESNAITFLSVPLIERARWTMTHYHHFIEDPSLLRDLLPRLKELHSGAVVDEWLHLLKTEQWEALVIELLQKHYDPRYLRSIRNHYSHSYREVEVPELSVEALQHVATELA